MGAVTADTVAVDLIANDNGYTAKMGNARKSLLSLESAAVSNANTHNRQVIPAFQKASSSADVFRGALQKLSAVVSVAAFIGLARSVLSVADELKDTSDQLGVTTQDLQGLASAALDTGASSDRLKQALGTLTDNLGDAEKGEGNLAKRMRELNIPLGTTMQVLFDLADAVQKADTQNKKMEISTTAFGKAGKALVPMLKDGADGLRRLLDEAKQKGQIWDPETVQKLDNASDAIERLKVKLTGKFANPFADIVAAIAGLPPSFDYLKRELDALEKRSNGPLSRLFNSFAISDVRSQMDRTNAAVPFSGTPVRPTPAARATVPKSKEELDRERAALDALVKQMNEAQNELRKTLGDDIVNSFHEASKAAREALSQTKDDAAAANDELSVAQNEANARRLQGTEAAYDAERTLLLDQTNSEIAEITRRKNAELTALAEQLKSEEAFQAARANVDATASAQIAAARAKFGANLADLEEAQTHAQRDQIEAMDGVRSSLVDIGLAAFDTSKNFGQAVGDILKQLALLVIKLELVKAVEGTLGNFGTTGGGSGGLLGPVVSGIGHLLGFAGGGVSRKPAIFAEAGPEAAVPLPDGRRIPVDLRGAGAGPSEVNIKLSVAVGGNGDKELMSRMRQGAQTAVIEALRQYDRNLPRRVGQINNDPFRMS